MSNHDTRRSDNYSPGGKSMAGQELISRYSVLRIYLLNIHLCARPKRYISRLVHPRFSSDLNYQEVSILLMPLSPEVLKRTFHCL